jgi:hypothetical protein
MKQISELQDILSHFLNWNKAGIENKRKMAGWNLDYVLEIVGVK